MADLFISYSRRDQQFVRALVERLSARGKECWVDWQDIPPTAEWIQEIYEGIEGSDAFVFVISPESARSATCRNEIEHAEKLNKRIVPILRRSIDGAELPDAIASRNWIPLPESVDLDEAVGRLVETVERDLDQVRRHTRWLAKALEWEKGDREPSLLLRGAELRAAEEWLAGAPGREPAPTSLQYEYAQASRAAATRRQRLVLAAFAVGIAVALGLAVVALIQRNREIAARETAESRLVASKALAQLNTKLDLGASLAVAAYRIKRTSEARDSVLVATRHSQHVVALLSPGCANVNVVRFSPDGTLLAGGCDGGTIVVWEPQGGQTIARLHSDGGAIRSLAFSPDSTLLAAVDAKQKLAAWRVGEGRRIRPVSVPSGLDARAVAFAPDGSLLVGTVDGIAVWRPGGRARSVATLGYSVDKIAIAADGTIAAGGLNGVTLLLLRKGQAPTQTPVGGDEIVQDLAFAPTGRRLAIVEGQLAFVREPRSGKLSPLRVPGARAVALGRRGEVATGALNGEVLLWDRVGRRESVFRLHRGAAITSVAFDGAHERIASASSGRVTVWNAEGSQLQRSFLMRLDALDALVVTGPGTFLAGGDGRVVRQEVTTDVQKRLTGAPGGQISLSSSLDGSVVAAGGSEAVVVWTRAGRQRSLSRPGDTPVAVAVSANGMTVAQATQHGSLDLWERPPGRTQPEVVSVTRSALKTVASAPSGHLFAAGSQDGSVWLVDAVTQRKRQVGKLDHASVEAVAFARGRDRLAAAGSNGTVTVWGVHSNFKRVFRARDAAVSSVAFDPRGTTMAAGDEAGNFFLWDARRGDSLGPALDLKGRVASLGFDPSGRTLAIGLHGGTVVLLSREAWDVGAAIDSLCTRLARC